MRTVVFMLFLLAPALAQSEAETRVLERVQKMLQQNTRVTFSELYNSPDLSPEEKSFLGRLYEIFFRIPAFLKTEYESTDRIPTLREIASGFGISPQSVALLLAVMESDPRLPPLFERNSESREIESLKLDQIESFVRDRGTEVKLTQWEQQPLPQFRLTGFQGETLTNADLSGKNVLLYFWFSGCPPCVRIAPILDDLNRRYGSSNFQVTGINADRVLELDTTDQQREEYLLKHNLSFANTHLDSATHKAFGNIQVFPTLFLVGVDGTIFRHLLNFQNRETLEPIIRELVGDQTQ
jgi:thiol-disulfide isomerase/thioredoxin